MTLRRTVVFSTVAASMVAWGLGCGSSDAVSLGDSIQDSGMSSSAGTGGSPAVDPVGTGGAGVSASGGGAGLGAGGSGGVTAGGGGKTGAGTGGGGGSVLDAGLQPGDSCESLVKAYQAAMTDAKRCDPAAGASQCQTSVNSLPCALCEIHVQDKATLDVIREKWVAASCNPGACPAVKCAVTAGSCVADVGGTTGSCVSKTF